MEIRVTESDVINARFEMQFGGFQVPKKVIRNSMAEMTWQLNLKDIEVPRDIHPQTEIRAEVERIS